MSQLACLPECKVSYRLLYNRICALGWPVGKAVLTPKGKTLKSAIRIEASQPQVSSKIEEDKNLIQKEKLKQIFKTPIKQTSSYVYWVRRSYGERL